MPWMLKKIWIKKKKDNTWKKNPNQTKSNFVAIFVAERSVKSGCEYSKVEGVLKLHFSRECSGKNHPVLALC